MEERRVKKSLLLVFAVLGLLAAGQTAASFSDCYKGCFILCVILPGNSIVRCGTECLKDCILPHTLLDGSEEQRRYSCKLGCAVASCANISSRDNPRENKVSSCVDSCSDTCSRN